MRPWGGALLRAVAEELQDHLSCVHSRYAHPSTLLFGAHEICSMERAQQGDPLGPLLFPLALRSSLDANRPEALASRLLNGNDGNEYHR
jgi:hypothetical protein